MSATPERVASFVLKFVIAPAVLAAVGYFIIGPAVGRMSSVEKSSPAELAPLKEEAAKVTEAAQASRSGEPVAPPTGTKPDKREPDVDIQVEGDAPEATKPKAEVPTTPPVDEPTPDETIEVPAQVDIKPAKPKPKTDTAKPKPATKPATQKPKPKDKPAQKLPDTPEVGDGGN